ncbi:hypothetical protein JCM1841_003725 [Sporobolomyces salmonicolor]
MVSNLRNLLAEGQDEAVSVNQRALVEKILARYSGEHTVFRELLQNSDDAGASTVELHFRTTTGAAASSDPQPLYSADALPDLKSTKCATIMVRNDGMVFRKEDWARLTEIASGNPDETKIGAFGVGFYSLFSLCDEPVVSSGDKVLGFYWKDGGDQLYVRSATDETGMSNVSSEGHPWSTFFMELREPQPMPEPNDFARFLSSCLGFTSNLRTLSLFFDGHLLFCVQKTLAPSRPLALKSNLSSSSPLKILKLASVEEAPIQLKAEVSNWMLRSLSKPKSIPSLAAAASTTTSFASKMLAAFSSKSSSSTPSPAPTPPPSKKDKEPLDFTTVTLFLRAVAATLKVSPSSHFHTEMVRATKKALPSMTRYSLIWTGKDEFDASQGNEDDEAEEARRVFGGLLSSLDVQGRVSIGFPTFQTTGNASSVGARFISTVERESLDFQAKYVADWNRELLWAGGVLARTVFEEEMAEIARLWKARPTLEAVERTRLEERALHLIKFFSFSRSTPQDIVGAMTEASFFASNSGTSLTLISSIGPTAAHKLRLPNSQLAGFIKEIPVVPELVNTNAPHFLAVLRDKGFIRDISLEDVFADLASHPLSIAEATECFKWWASLASNRSYDVRLLGRLQEAAMLSVPSPTNKDDFQIYPLGGFKAYLNPKTVSVDLPLPEHTLPFELSRHFSANDLSRVFQFSELSLVAWVRHLLSPSMVGKEAKVETNLLKAPPFAERVLAVLAKGWAQVPAVQQKELVTILAEQAFVPTRLGPRKPSESYLPNVVLFDDLAITTLPSGAPIKGNMEKLLLALGVRRHVELQLVFTRLLGAGDWSHIQLVRYLVSVKDTLSATELDRLRKTSWLPKEGEAKVESPAGADGVKPKSKTIRHMAGDLYEPTETFRELGLPLLDWSTSQTKWRSASDEAKLLYDLGLLRTPPVEQVLQIAASPASPERQEKALRYFLDGCVTLGYGSTYSPSKHAFAFVPAVEKGKATLAKPMEVFGNPDAAVLGFPILSSKYAAEESRFRILRDPPSSALVAALVGSPPQTIEEASKIFSYLSSQVSHFASADMEALSWAAFVPIRRPDGKVEILPPLNLFFKSDENLPAGLRSLFTTIPDFGLAARPFLVACGVKESPSTLEVASMLIADPPRFYDLAGSAERYLSILRLLALNYSSLSSTLRSRMKMSAFFLGTKRILNTSSSNNKTLLDDDSDDDEGSETLVYQLARASELAINDEPAAFRVFQADILACPQEDALEALAEQLGAHRISRLITEQYRTVGEPDEGAKRAVELHRAVAERTFLFLSERRQQYGKGELKHDPDWIQSHLQVYEVRSIELIRTLKSAQGLKKSSHAASACAQLAKNGDVALYIAQNIDVDYYEVAMSLCKLLLSKLRPNDALLLLTILQTTLRNLKRRGFNVDRILNARKAEKEAADQRMREERLQAQLKVAEALSPEKLAAYTQELSNMFPDADPDFLRTLLQTQDAPQLENAANQLLASPHYPKRRDSKGSSGASLPSGPFQQQSVASPAQHQPPTISFSSGGLFSNFRKQFARPEPRPSSPLPPPPSLTPPAPTVPPERPAGMVPGPSRPATTPTSTDAIRANLTRAIQAARPETASNVSNAVQKTAVQESESYCDSTAAASLSFIASIAGLRFFASRDVPDPTSFVAENHDALVRYVTKVLRPVGEVFGLDPQALHVFHDLEGPLIAFNRNGSLYCNSRYYFAWHDKMVQEGKLEEPLISTFHTLAHELAHNLVKPHDAEHSFYFSSFCEEYFLPMARLLQQIQAAPST